MLAPQRNSATGRGGGGRYRGGMITLADCRAADAADPLAPLAARFAPGDAGAIYLDANSIGAMPRDVPARVAQLLQQGWAEQRRRSWSTADWLDQPRALGAGLSAILGADPEDVVVCDTTTVNLFKLLTYALRLQPDRRVVVAERHVFPTDLYVAEGLARHAGVSLRLIDHPDELPAALGDDVAVVYLSHVDYRSSRRWDMGAVNRAAHAAGAFALWDLSHSAGANVIDLRGTDADFAVGCGYKYLSGGPGAPALLYVHPRHHDAAWPTICGWSGHADPFAFDSEFVPTKGPQRHLAASPAVLANAAFGAAVAIWRDVSPTSLDRKHRALSATATDLLTQQCGALGVTVTSPRSYEAQGGHVGFSHDAAAQLSQALVAAGVICSFRKPDTIRFGLGPLALGHQDLWQAVARLREILQTAQWREPRFATAAI
jgi:kynureninase